MSENRDNNGGNISVIMKLSGRYDDVVSKIAVDDHSSEDVKTINEDFERILATVDAINGGTKSVIVEKLRGNVGGL